MNTKFLADFKSVIGTIILSLVLFVPQTSAAKDKKEKFDKTTVYGWQLMSTKERKQHRLKMRSFKTDEERQAYRKQHHEKMQARAKAQGVTLPEIPMPQGKGMGQGMGPGMGKGMGQGMGPGMGQGMGQGNQPEKGK